MASRITAIGPVGELAEILALGLMRAAARKSSRKSPQFGESQLDFSPDQSGGADRFSLEDPT